MKALIGASIAALVIGTGAYLVVGSDSGESDVAQDSKGRSSKGKTKGESRASTSRSTERGDLDARVAKLEREVKQLRMQAKLRGAPSTGGGAVALGEDPEATAVIHEVVQDAFQDAKQEERERRTERRNERMEERRGEALQALAAAGIAGAKTQEIGKLWNGEQEELLPLIESARSGDASWRETREQVDAIRTATDEAAYAMLDEGERAAYDENRPGPGPRGGGRGGGRGGRGGGQGGAGAAQQNPGR